MFIRAMNVLGIKTKDGTGPIYPGMTAEVDDQQGNSMVERGVAVEVSKSGPAGGSGAPAVSIPSANPSEGENAPEGPKTAVYDDDAFLSENTTFAELKSFAEECGVYRSSMRSKAAIIEALKRAKVNDAFPDLTPQDVIDE